MTRYLMCPACMFKGMHAAMDKKSRPFFKCISCSAILFVRIGPLGMNSVAATLRLLEVETTMRWVRAEAYKNVALPGQGLHALLGLGQARQSSADEAVPAAELAQSKGAA